MKITIVVAVISSLLSMDGAVGSFHTFLQNLPFKLYDAFSSTWSIIKKNLNVTISPSRHRRNYKKTTPLQPVAKTSEAPVFLTSTSTPAPLTDWSPPEQSTARPRCVNVIPFIITRQTSLFWWKWTTPSNVLTSSQAPIDSEKQTNRIRYAFIRRNNILYPVKRMV